MTTTSTRKAGPPTAVKTAADRAYEKRQRRLRRMADPRMTEVGAPIRDAIRKIPFVVVVIVLLAVGGVGVLYLNTRSDEVGMRTNESRDTSADLRLQIESLERDVAALDATPEIARKAKEMGLVQAGDPAIITIGPDGKSTVIGQPHPAGTPATADGQGQR